MMPCVVCSSGPVEAAHVKARGMGGCGGDRRSLVPLCTRCHREQHAIGLRAFGEKYEIDLHDHAARIALQLDEEGHE